MKNGTNNIFTVTSFLVLALILTPSLVMASFTDAWGQYQDDHTLRGFINDETAQWQNTSYVRTTAENSDYQALIIDTDQDGQNDIITFDDQTVRIYDKNLNIKQEYNFAKPIKSQPALITNDTHFFLMTATQDKFNTLIIEHDGTMTLNQTLSIASYNSTMTGVTGRNETAYLISSDGTSTYLTTFHANNYTMTKGPATSPNAVLKNPALEDIDHDSKDEIVFICDADGNGKHGLCVIDTSTEALDTGFSSDGIIDDLENVPEDHISSPLIYNVGSDATVLNTCYDSCDSQYPEWYNFWNRKRCYTSCEINYGIGSIGGGGYHEIFVTYSAAGTCSSVGSQDLLYLGGYKSTGAVMTGFPATSTASGSNLFDCSTNNYDSSLSQPIAAFRNGEIMICLAQDGIFPAGSDNLNLIGCVDPSTGSVNYSISTGSNEVVADDITSILALRNTGDFDMNLVVSPFIYSFDNGHTLNFTVQGITTAYHLSSSDLDGDGNVELVYTGASGTKIIHSTYTNEPPELNHSLVDSGFTASPGVSSPICVNTTVTFEAQETGGNTAGNYENDDDQDTERIASNCGQLTTGHPSSSSTEGLENGTLAGSNPVFQCYFNQTGTFTVRLYLQDDSNPSDMTESDDKLLTVINGEPGVTCNTASAETIESLGSTSSTGMSGQEAQVTGMWGILFGADQNIRLLIGLGLILGIALMGAKVAGMIGFTGGAVISSGMLAIMGLISAWIVVFMVISMALLLFVGNILGITGQSGGNA